MTKNEKISALALIVLVGFFIAVVFHYAQGMYIGKGYPYNTFLFNPEYQFTDFYSVVAANSDLNPYFRESRQMQFPFLNLLGFLFSLVKSPINHGLFILIVIEAMITSFMVFLKSQNQKTNWIYIFILTFLTFPFLFMLDRGNFDGLILAFLVAFIYFFSQKRYLISSIFLSFAIAMKVIPAVLLVLFIPEKKYKEIALSVAVTILITVISLLFFQGNFWDKLLVTVSLPRLPDLSLSGYLSSNNFSFKSVSLFTISKLYFIETGIIQNINIPNFLDSYVKFSLITFVMIALYVIFIEKVLWKRTVLLIIALELLPQLTAEYRLLYMFAPLFLFINASQTSKFDRFYVTLFGLLLIPKSYYFFPITISDSGFHDFNIGVVISVLLMLMMLICIISTGLFTRFNEIRLFQKESKREVTESVEVG